MVKVRSSPWWNGAMRCWRASIARSPAGAASRAATRVVTGSALAVAAAVPRSETTAIEKRTIRLRGSKATAVPARQHHVVEAWPRAPEGRPPETGLLPHCASDEQGPPPLL
jgi:hypothetical protein